MLLSMRFLALLLVLGCSTHAQRAKRIASHIGRDTIMWPIDKPIPFVISPDYDYDQKQIIRAGLRTFKENTCFEFEESSGPERKLEFRMTGEGCGSHIGDWRGEMEGEYNHLIQFDPRCVQESTVQHETMHALGFDHTMSRPDRDQYMDFNGDNLGDDEKWKLQYRILYWMNFNNHSLPYEYNSVMHYASTDGSKNGKPILTPKNMDYITSVGGTLGATFNDWKAVNLRYNCIGKNCSTQIDCKNNGYQHPRDCNRCACPIFYEGNNCEIEINAINLQPELPTHFTFEQKGGTYTQWSPAFTTFKKERHVIKAPEGHRIRITLDKINPGFEINCIRACDLFAVEIVDGDMSLVGKRFCCSNTTAKTFLSDSNVIGYQVYAKPGMEFSSKVTFTIEPNEYQPSIVNMTEFDTKDVFAEVSKLIDRLQNRTRG